MIPGGIMHKRMELKLRGRVLYRPNEAEIQRKENMWRLKLPLDYRHFLKEYNGGVPEKSEFKGIHSNRTYMVETFLSIIKVEDYDEFGDYDIDVIHTQLDERLSANGDLVGYDMVPIAQIFAGDYVCLDYRESSDHPCVCVWSHEESGEFDPVTYKIADSFTQFIEMLF